MGRNFSIYGGKNLNHILSSKYLKENIGFYVSSLNFGKLMICVDMGPDSCV